ncbi:hypothetical protein C8R46DRAFT_1081385 [Mycena filopes]|nr:hypothetical protein C8R46DRAFT_1081385 [Mycena filopes]
MRAQGSKHEVDRVFTPMPTWLAWNLRAIIFPKRGVFRVSLLFIPLAIGGTTFFWLRRPAFWLGRPARRLRRLLRVLCPASRRYRTYSTALEEDRYWKSATMYRRRLQRSDARFQGSGTAESPRIPVLLTSYMPALLPRYRENRRRAVDNYYLPLRALCKWHRMVFPGPRHPSISQAAMLRDGFSAGDRREIRRISRMLPDEEVFGAKARWRPKYRRIWREWLAREGRRGEVVFNEVVD